MRLRNCGRSVRKCWLGRGVRFPVSTATSAETSLRREILAAAEQVRGLAAARSVPQIEEDLLQIEQGLMQRLIAALPAEQRTALEREVDSELEGYRSADARILETTRRANLLRLLRRNLSLPRLSLFS